MSKIKLLIDLPVDGIHGMKKGRIFEVVKEFKGSDRARGPRWQVMGEGGVLVGVMPHEAENAKDKEDGGE